MNICQCWPPRSSHHHPFLLGVHMSLHVSVSISVLQIRSSIPFLDFPGGSEGKASAYSVGDLGSIPRSGRSCGEGNGYSLQYSCLENSMDRGTWLIHIVVWQKTTPHCKAVILWQKNSKSEREAEGVARTKLCCCTSRSILHGAVSFMLIAS